MAFLRSTNVQTILWVSLGAVLGANLRYWLGVLDNAAARLPLPTRQRCVELMEQGSEWFSTAYLRGAPRLAILLAVTLVGCSRSGGEGRLPVYGTVTDADGEKINGSISFVPDQGRPGPSAIASVKDGEYRFDGTNGPMAGPHRVTVTQTVAKDPSAKTAAIPQKAMAAKKGIAGPSFPGQPTLSADVPAKGPYKLDFQLP